VESAQLAMDKQVELWARNDACPILNIALRTQIFANFKRANVSIGGTLADALLETNAQCTKRDYNVLGAESEYAGLCHTLFAGFHIFCSIFGLHVQISTPLSVKFVLIRLRRIGKIRCGLRF
jgi:hypothetical protein